MNSMDMRSTIHHALGVEHLNSSVLITYNPRLPPNWSNFSIKDFEHTLGCREIFSKPRPIHDESVWEFLRETYHAVTDLGHTSVTEAFVNNEATPYYVDYSPGKGRGLFASEDIAIDTLVWQSTNTVSFDGGESFRHYLATIPSDLACDVIGWAYLDDDPDDDDEVLIKVDLDPGSFCNDGGIADRNIEFGDYKMTHLESDFSLREIKKGEEILCHYSSFEDTAEWETEFGL